MKYQVKNNNAPQNTRVCLMRFFTDGFQPYNVITVSSLSLEPFTVAIVHAEKCSSKFTSPFALEYKQSEHEDILYEMLRKSKELENVTYRYCKNIGKIPSTMHCQIIQNRYPES